MIIDNGPLTKIPNENTIQKIEGNQYLICFEVPFFNINFKINIVVYISKLIKSHLFLLNVPHL